MPQSALRNSTLLPTAAFAAILSLAAVSAAAQGEARLQLHEAARSQIESADFAGAVESLQELSLLCSRSIGVSNNLGVALAASGDYQAGLRELARLVDEAATAGPAAADEILANRRVALDNRRAIREVLEYWEDEDSLAGADVQDLNLVDAIDACPPLGSQPPSRTRGGGAPPAAPEEILDEFGGDDSTAAGGELVVDDAGGGEPPGEEGAPDPVESAILDALVDWVAAWQTRQANEYLNSYSPSFVPADGTNRDEWEAAKRQRIGDAEFIEVIIGDEADPGEVDVTRISDMVGRAQFRQTYRSNTFSDVVNKTLVFVQEDGSWRILTETAEPVSP